MRGEQQLGVHREEALEGCRSQEGLSVSEKLMFWGRGRSSWEREGPDANLVEGPLLMCVLCELVNEGVQLLWDDHTVRGTGPADVGAGPSFHL